MNLVLKGRNFGRARLPPSRIPYQIRPPDYRTTLSHDISIGYGDSPPPGKNIGAQFDAITSEIHVFGLVGKTLIFRDSFSAKCLTQEVCGNYH